MTKGFRARLLLGRLRGALRGYRPLHDLDFRRCGCPLVDIDVAKMIGDELQGAEVDGATWSFPAGREDAARTAFGDGDVA